MRKAKNGTPFEARQFIKISIEPSIILQQVEVSGKADTKVNTNEKLALETLKECLVGDNPFAQAHLEDWRQIFYERHTQATNLKAKKPHSVGQENGW